MTRMCLHLLLGSTALLLSTPALAGNIAKCEVAVMQTVVDEDGGVVSFGSYHSAVDFLKSVYDPDIELVRDVDGHPIQGLICARNNLMPDDDDYTILATGIPLVLTQNLDRLDSKTLTLFYGENAFDYRYASDVSMDQAFEDLLEARLDTFSARDHGLIREVTETEERAVDSHDPTPSLDEVDVELTEPVEDLVTQTTTETVMTVDTQVTTAPETEIINPFGDILVETLPEESLESTDLSDKEIIPSVEISDAADFEIDLETGEIVPVDGNAGKVEN